jgi:hypothetical protein
MKMKIAMMAQNVPKNGWPVKLAIFEIVIAAQ